jgi:hypothetical protein
MENASRSAAVMGNAPSRSCKEAVMTTTTGSSPPVGRDVPLAALELLPGVVPAGGGRDGAGGADGL